MDSSRWQRIQSLFHEAVDLPEHEQRSFLTSRCKDDAALLAEVLTLLQEDSRGSSLLDNDVASLAHQVLVDSDSALPLREFGPYRIKEVLGEGGMGVVYLAKREDLGSLVAVKILRDAWMSPARRERFAFEQRTLAQLIHPSIARLYDADTSSDGTPFFVMEYVEGVPLTQYCNEHKSSVQERLRLFRAVCEAVLYAHQHAVIHRDLKPSNILVKEDGTVRLLDFGIAKHLESLGESVDQTMTGLRLLTPAYAAPEQIRGEQVGIHTDVYSLGVILYELLTGRPAFDLSNRTPAQAEKVLTEREAQKPSVVAHKARSQEEHRARAVSASKAAWSELDVLCLTAIHKDVQRRYRSVEALIRDIDHYLKGEPLEARPDTLGYRLRKFFARNRRAVAATGAVFAVIIGMVVFFTVRLAKARDAALAEAARTRRIQHFMINLFQGGDESAGPADDLRVVTLVERGVREAETLKADPKERAELIYNFGGISEQLGKLDQADSLLASSLEQRKSLFGPDSAEVAESLIALGGLRSDQARYEEAEKLIRQGLEMDRRHLPPNHPATGQGIHALGSVLESRGDYEQAIKVLDEAVRVQSAPGGVPADLAVSLTDLANCHFYLGHYDTSQTLNERALLMDRQLYGDRHPNVAEDLINLGAIQTEQQHFAETERDYRQALDILQSFWGKDHPETASVMSLLGRVLVREGRLDEASSVLRQALAIEERAYPKMHPRIAGTLGELGKIAEERGELNEAEADFTRMADIYRSVYNGKHYYIGVALANLGSVSMDRKQYSRAEKIFRESLRQYDGTLPPEHENVGIGRIRLGRALLRERRFSEAESESRAGYEIMMKQTSPPQAWLHNVCTDLVEEYTALKQPEKAKPFRAQLVKLTSDSSAASARK